MAICSDITVTFTLALSLCGWLWQTSLADPSDFSREKTKIWGPGLKSGCVLPARYFFIHASDSQGKLYTESLGEKAFSVNIHSGNVRVRVWNQILDRHDGSYIVRYKLFGSYKDLHIDVLHDGKHVAESPYSLKGSIYNENCYCPLKNMDKWMKVMECPKSYSQIKQDLSIFSNFNMEAVAEEAVSRFNKAGQHSLCHYVIKNNKIYRKTYGEHVGFKIFMDAILLSLTRKVHLPDLEFFVNLGDWPLEKKRIEQNPIPILSWCGSDETRDIVMPTYDVTESTLETMGRVTLDLLSVQANTGPRWENKTDMAFWRGRDSRQERLDLVKLGFQNKDIIDARLSNMFFFKHDPEEHGELVKHISFFDFFKRKYQISIDGTVAAYRLPYLLASDALVLKQDSHYYEHFYKQLKPYKHYLPFKRDLSDLLEVIQWAKDNDEESQQIAKNAQEYVRNNLLGTDIFCYHAVLFKEYAKKISSNIKVREGMELVPQPSDEESKCDCKRLKKVKDEL